MSKKKKITRGETREVAPTPSANTRTLAIHDLLLITRRSIVNCRGYNKKICAKRLDDADITGVIANARKSTVRTINESKNENLCPPKQR